MDAWTDGRMDGWGWMDGWMDGSMDRWTEGWRDGWGDGGIMCVCLALEILDNLTPVSLRDSHGVFAN